MTRIELPALDGRTALGFLAGCGTLRLLAEERGHRARLGWSVVDASARLEVDGLVTVDDVVAELAQVVGALDGDVLVPGGPPGFPAGGRSSDPVRMPVGEFAGTVGRWRDDVGDETVERWVPAMVTDLVEREGAVHITQFAAPSGQQKFATALKLPPPLAKGPVQVLTEAFTGWRRHPGVTGEYLDHRVLRSAADQTDGRSKEAGVPGATWLALMAWPWFPAGGDGHDRRTVGWQRVGRRRELFRWPLWEPMLDPPSVRAVVDHPLVDLALQDGQLAADVDGLGPLGVFDVRAVTRQRIEGRNFEGVLAPVPVAHRRRDRR